MMAFDQLPMDKMEAWCQMPDAPKPDPEAKQIEEFQTKVREKFPKVTIEMGEPAAYVLVAALPYGPADKQHGIEPELTLLDKFDAGFAELLREARRVNGIVRKQWFIVTVWAKPEPKDDVRPFALGIGIATERGIARARALHSAEVRAQIFAESMFSTKVTQKPVPAAPAPASTTAS